MKRICIQWPRFGPYHLARLRATSSYVQQHGATVYGLEIASEDATYTWRTETTLDTFERIQLFPGSVFEALPAHLIYQRVRQALDKISPDAVAINSYSMPDAHACLTWCRKHHRVAVVLSDATEQDATRIAWREHLKSRLIRQFDAALVAGTPHRDYLKRLGYPEDQIFFGCDVVDNDYFRIAADEHRLHTALQANLPGLETTSPFFLVSSRFIVRKNLSMLLEAYRRYRAWTAAPWRLVVLGDGPERSVLESFIQQHDLQGVTLASFRQIDELPAYYGRARVFVHPAHTDQWGLVVNEAMASGLPVLVSAGAGCVQDLVVEGQNGFIFPSDDPASLAHLLNRMATLPETERQSMGRRSQELIQDWSLERFASSLWQAIQQGQVHAHRSMDPLVTVLLWTLRHTPRSIQFRHSPEI